MKNPFSKSHSKGHEDATSTPHEESISAPTDRLSTLHIATHSTILSPDMKFSTTKSARSASFYVAVNNDNGDCTLYEANNKKGTELISGKRTRQPDFYILNGFGGVEMRMRGGDGWFFEVPVSDAGGGTTSLRNIDGDGGKKQAYHDVTSDKSDFNPSTTSSSRGNKTLFSWHLKSPETTRKSTESPSQATVEDPDLVLKNEQTGEIHAAYVVDRENQKSQKICGTVEFRKSYGSEWDRLVLVGMAVLLERARRLDYWKGSAVGGVLSSFSAKAAYSLGHAL